MNTPTHLLVAAAAFAWPGHPRRALGGLAGGLLPDLSLYVMVGWERFVNERTPREIFGEEYWSPFWQTAFAVDNSAPLYALLLAIGIALRQPWLWALGGAALLHIACDLPLHHDDGRAHFQPFTDWVFQSPFSYWDRAHFGDIVGMLEIALAACLAILLWRRFETVLSRMLTVSAFGALAATGPMWRIVLA